MTWHDVSCRGIVLHCIVLHCIALRCITLQVKPIRTSADDFSEFTDGEASAAPDGVDEVRGVSWCEVL